MSTPELPRSAECVIVGGGAIGCSLAYHLAQAGMRPLLLERDALGSGSTGRCAGGVRQQFSTEVNVRVGMLSRRMLERFEEEVGTTAAFRQIGYLFLATDDAEAERFRANVAMQQRAGLDDVRLVSAADAAELVPGLRTDDVRLGTYCPSDGVAGPNEITTGYAAAARRHGAVIVEGAAVTGIDVRGGAVRGVRCGDHPVAADLVINCAGAYAGELARLAGVEVPVLPYRRHVFVTEPVEVARGIPMTVDMPQTLYFHPEGEGLLLGMSDTGDAPTFDTGVDWGFLEKLVEAAVRRLPALEHAGIATGWAGLYEVTPDHQGIIGEHPELRGLWLCCGFSGHGFMMAPGAGRICAQRIRGEQPEIDVAAFAPDRFGGAALQPEASVI